MKKFLLLFTMIFALSMSYAEPISNDLDDAKYVNVVDIGTPVDATILLDVGNPDCLFETSNKENVVNHLNFEADYQNLLLTGYDVCIGKELDKLVKENKQLKSQILEINTKHNALNNKYRQLQYQRTGNPNSCY